MVALKLKEQFANISAAEQLADVKTLGQALREYQLYVESNCPKSTEKLRLARKLKNEHLLAPLTLDEITYKDIEQYCLYRKSSFSIAASTLNGEISTIISAISYTCDRLRKDLSMGHFREIQRALNKNGFTGKSIPRERTLTKSESVRIYDWLKQYENTRGRSGNKYSLAFAILCETGLRAGEVLELRRSDIDFQSNVFTIPRSKNNECAGEFRRQYGHSITPFLLPRFEDACANKMGDEKLFPFVVSTLSKHCLNACKELDILDASIRDARTTFATNVIRNNLRNVGKFCIMNFVKERLGHASFNTTERWYAKVSANESVPYLKAI